MASTTTHCVLLADRHHALSEGVRGLLEASCGSVLMVADAASLRDGVARARPDLVIGDLDLARSDRLAWVRDLRGSWPQLKLIVLSVHDEESVRQAVLQAGADAFVLKRSIATDLLPTVERLCAGRAAH